MDLDLAGVHVLVTGANSGIGLETTKTFLSQGAFVTAHYRSSADTLAPLLSSYPSHLRLAKADVTSETDVAALFTSASASTETASPGPVEVLVVNHGYYAPPTPLKDMSLAHWTGTLDANVTSAFLVCREYLRGLEAGVAAKGEGRYGERAAIVFVGSTAGKFGEAGSADFASSKSVLMYGLTLTLKNEIVRIAPRARVNTVAPGWVRTPAVAHKLDDPSILYKALATTPLQKVATSEDVARQIVILASSSVSGHVTGQVVMVHGGMEGRLLNRPTDLGLPATA
ncbi:unnamed protein product [Peniophora sp. CBMAI 1063]|nr:unnamed protein product [Peniophora sp. CBMAI 1063]